MRRICITIACLSFFVLAGVAWASGLDVLDCAIRAGVGAAAAYFLASVTGDVVLSAMASAVSRNRKGPTGE